MTPPKDNEVSRIFRGGIGEAVSNATRQAVCVNVDEHTDEAVGTPVFDAVSRTVSSAFKESAIDILETLR